MLKLYVLVRSDITPAQQAVQAGHALAQFGLDHPIEFGDWQDDNNTLIYLSVKNIDYWKTLLSDGEFTHSVFREPELRVPRNSWQGPPGSTMIIAIDTAIAVAPNWTCQYVLFKDLPLATFTEPTKKKVRWWNRL